MEEMDKENISDTCVLLDSLKCEISSIQNSTMEMGDLLDIMLKNFTALKEELSISSEAQNTVLQGKLAAIFESLNSFVELMTTIKVETDRVQDQMTFISDSYQKDENLITNSNHSQSIGNSYQQDENATTLASETDSNHSGSQSHNEDEGEVKTNLKIDIKSKTENDALDLTIHKNDDSTTLVEGKVHISPKGVVSTNLPSCVCCEKEFTSCQDLNTHLDEMHIRTSFSLGHTESFAGERLNEIDKNKKRKFRHPVSTRGLRGQYNIKHRKTKPAGTKSNGKHPNTKAQDPHGNVDPYGEKWPKDCAQCDGTFQDKKTYDRHTRAASSKCVRTFNCCYCSQTFTHRKALRGHVRYWHLKLRQAKCDICGRMMSGKTALERHKLVHSGVKDFACDQCDGRFTSKDTLESHVIRVHENRRDHVCEICAKAFHTKGYLNIHLASHNTEGVEYKCEECGRVCNTARNLKIHMARHQEKRFECDLCDLKFHVKGDLTIHRRVHTGEKPFCCEKCGKSFTHGSSKRAHSRKCGEEPKLACKFCDKKFYEKHNVKFHMRESCPMKPEDERELERIMAEVFEDDKGGVVEPYRCSKCGKSFVNGSTMTRHEEVCGIAPSLQCDKCSKRFVELWRLQEHERNVHVHSRRARPPRKLSEGGVHRRNKRKKGTHPSERDT